MILLLLACAGVPEPAAPVVPDAPAARTLRGEGMIAWRAQDWVACADAFDRALVRAPESAADAYNAACCLALAGRTELALARLKSAADLGYRDPDHLAVDSDLASLHDTPAWAAVLAQVQATAAERRSAQNEELRTIFLADQEPRLSGRPLDSDTDRADAERLSRVTAILATGGARVADDYFHAAMVFQHGKTEADFWRARELALAAVALDPSLSQARWLVAAAEDRAQMTAGRPQRYGTQARNVGNGWELYAVDPSVTDAERALWEVPTLAEAKARIAAMNTAGTAPR